jgi:hypothetical protein
LQVRSDNILKSFQKDFQSGKTCATGNFIVRERKPAVVEDQTNQGRAVHVEIDDGPYQAVKSAKMPPMPLHLGHSGDPKTEQPKEHKAAMTRKNE